MKSLTKPRILGVVPARGGSKRFPNKNLALLGGEPLIVWALKCALESHIFNEVVVTTDDPEIAKVANEYWGSDISHLRDPRLARDDTPMLPVIVDVFENHPADIIVTLQPTSPLRRPGDIVGAVDLLTTTGGDSVFSTTDAPKDLAFEVGHAKRLRQLPNVVVPNGALFLLTAGALERGESWFSGVAYGYPMPKDRSIDIDTLLDMEIARMIVEGNK